MKQISLLILCSLASPLLGFSQNPALTSRALTPSASESKRKNEEKQNQNDLKRARAVGLIEQTAQEAPLWQEPEAMVNALTESADLLWAENPKAPVWLTKAWDSIGKIEERENPEALRQIWHGSQRSRMRTIVLSVALKRDAQLADRFLRTLEQNESEAKSERGAFDDRSARSEQLLRLSSDAVDNNPALALTLAQASLQDGISFNLQTILLQLRLKNTTLADQLFDSALARLMRSPAALGENQVLASYLFRPGQVVARLSDGSITVAVVQTKVAEQTPAQSDPARARVFLAVTQRMLLSQPLPADSSSQTAGEFVLLADSLAQPFQTYAPDLWQPIAVRRGQFAALLPGAAAKSSGISEKVREAAKSGATAVEINRLRVEALEEIAEKEADPVGRKLMFAEAALATLPQNLERGKQLADKIEQDDELRTQVTTFLYYRASLSSYSENNLEKAELLALSMPLSLERALALIAVAQKLAGLKPQSQDDSWTADLAHQHAIELLFEADKSLKNETASAKLAKVRLGKIPISQLVDSSQALSDFEQAIAVINKLEQFDPADEANPRLGIEGFAVAKLTVPKLSLGFGFRSALEPLLKENFDATIAAIDGLSSPSVRGICRLLAARQVLNSLPRVSNQTKTARAQATGNTPRQ